MYLSDFTALAEKCRESGGGGLSAFCTADCVLELEWPDDVTEQWLYDHSGNESFLEDYGGVDLRRIRWALEVLPAIEIAEMPTGKSDHDFIDYISQNPHHWIGNRRYGVHIGVAEVWQLYGTWKRWPLLIDRALLNVSEVGLQVLEGRTRVGVLKGLLQRGDFTAERHLAWVARSTK